VYSGRYQREKKVFEYSSWLGMSSMSLMKPIVVCLYVCVVNAFSCWTSSSLKSGLALFLLYSPSTARASVLKPSAE
jgi:hypothetical protein